MLKIRISDKNYRAFIDYAIKSCTSVSLVFERDKADICRYVLQEEYYSIANSVVSKKRAIIHPDTGSRFENADVLCLKIDTFVSAFLKQADSIFSWNGEKLPEELCFYRNGEIWFSCTCHAKLLRIHCATPDDLFFFENKKIEAEQII